MNILAESDVEAVFKAFHEHGAFWAVVAAVLLTVWFFIDDRLKDLFDHYIIKRILLKKRFTDELVSEIFEGKVELVNKKTLVKKASKERILQFYSGAKLHWDVIAANGDISRDQVSELKKLAESPSRTTRLICVTAEAGAGKSTIAWRVAADFTARETGSLIIRVVASEDAEVWQRLSKFRNYSCLLQV